VNCAGVRDALPGFALGVAPTQDASSVELHVETCAACRREAVDLQRAVAAFGYALAPAEPAAPELEDRVVSAVHAAAGHGARQRTKRHRRASVTLLAAAILLAALGTGVVMANRAERLRLQAARTALQQDEMLSRFGEAVTSAQFSDPGADVLTGMLATTHGQQGAGSALTIVSPSSDDQVIVLVSDLPARVLPLTVTIAGARGRTLELGAIRRLDSGGGATFARIVPGSLDGFVDVTILGVHGRVLLRGTLAAETAVASPTP